MELDWSARGRDVLGRFLADRRDRTLLAYRADIDDFARFVGTDAPDAIAQLLSAGHAAGRRLVLDYAIDLRRRGRANATISRRLATIRGVLRTAEEAGEMDWTLDVPSDEEIAAAAEARASSGVPYLFPRHASEADRLDVQHYALREALGANYLAPIEPPVRALDVGSGTGQWSFELCQQFPDALVVGLDLVPSKPDRPPGFRWVRANLLHGLPFASGRFDFVYQRLLVVGVPLASWPAIVAELVRVARRGGWVEIVEPVVGTVDAGPATQRLIRLAMEIASANGLDTTDVVFRSLDEFLRQAGLVEVVRRQVSIPVGPWGGRVGSFMATDMRAMQMRIGEVLQARGRITPEECHDLLQQALGECEHLRMSFQFAVAYGRKP